MIDWTMSGTMSEGKTLEELKVNMTNAIILMLRSINKEAEERGEKKMIIKLPI
jgi:predicted RNase H-like HicB family nuclease